MSSLIGETKRRRALEARLKLCDSLQGYLLELQQQNGLGAIEPDTKPTAIDHGGMQVLRSKKSDDDGDSFFGGTKKKKGKKKGGKKKGGASKLQHPVLRLNAFHEVGIEPPLTAAALADTLAAVEKTRSALSSGEMAVEAASSAPEPEPEPTVEQQVVPDLGSFAKLGEAQAAEGAPNTEEAPQLVEPVDPDVSAFLDGIEENPAQDDDGEMKAGQANGYGTVAVDLAAEAEKAKATMKALRAAQMNKPPPVAMKKNPITGEMEKFESPALKDDLSDEDVDGDIDVGDMGCGADDY